MLDSIPRSPVVAFPAERILAAVADIAGDVHDYCIAQGVALSVDHYMAMDALVEAVNDLDRAVVGVAASLPPR